MYNMALKWNKPLHERECATDKLFGLCAIPNWMEKPTSFSKGRLGRLARDFRQQKEAAARSLCMHAKHNNHVQTFFVCLML